MLLLYNTSLFKYMYSYNPGFARQGNLHISSFLDAAKDGGMRPTFHLDAHLHQCMYYKKLVKCNSETSVYDHCSR